ncbi:hypothetical protein pdam_00008526 [Pocillopora damicornis]|uniref:Uncharacterized protein n=1 Tax=Pocillopora damicornis TaxID=46731 RepID=A0A3M6U296_POCDA|nr:hypothetical protein pdam_00008526 [Pocillopora damicornis]
MHDNFGGEPPKFAVNEPQMAVDYMKPEHCILPKSKPAKSQPPLKELNKLVETIKTEPTTKKTEVEVLEEGKIPQDSGTDSEEEDIVRDDTYLDINVNLGDKLMSTVVEQIGSNPKYRPAQAEAPQESIQRKERLEPQTKWGKYSKEPPLRCHRRGAVIGIIIKDLFAKYEANPRNLKEYVTNLAINTPPPLTANAQRPDKEEAIRNYVSQYNHTNLVN